MKQEKYNVDFLIKSTKTLQVLVWFSGLIFDIYLKDALFFTVFFICYVES